MINVQSQNHEAQEDTCKDTSSFSKDPREFVINRQLLTTLHRSISYKYKQICMFIHMIIPVIVGAIKKPLWVLDACTYSCKQQIGASTLMCTDKQIRIDK